MKRCLLMLMAIGLFHVIAGNVLAAPQKVQITEFTVVGAENTQELKNAIKSLLSSRITTGDVLAVDDDSGVIARINGGYTSFGKTFSIDASVKSASGEMLGRRYVQGENPSDLIPAIGRLAEQLRALLHVKPSTPQVGATVGVSPSAKDVAGTPALAGRLTTLQASKVPSEDIVRSVPPAKAVVPQTRIEGTLLGIAPGRKRADDEREYIVADARHVYLYHQAKSLRKVYEYSLKGEGKILSIDTADMDGDGVLEVYVTVMDREELVSQALLVSDQGFSLIASDLPYFFRAMELNKQRKLYAQQTGRGTDDYYGNVYQVVKKGNTFVLGESVKLPKNGNIYAFSRMTDAQGKLLSVTIDADGNLHVSDENGKELWSGNDRFGGSEVYFQKDDQQMQNIAVDRFRWRFIEQRITVTPDGEIVVPRNNGNSFGNSRSYNKNTVFALVWNGAILEERWRTREKPGYLADYYFDAERREMVTLEQVQKEGLFSKGASVILINKID